MGQSWRIDAAVARTNKNSSGIRMDIIGFAMQDILHGGNDLIVNARPEYAEAMDAPIMAAVDDAKGCDC